MREIKFRSWVENDRIKDSIYPFMNYRIEFMGGAINDIFATSGQAPSNPLGNKITYMQYTGLKDKNGKEIYEGDLFRWEEDAVGVIKFRDGSFYLETNIALPCDSVHAPGFYSPWLRAIKFELENELEIIGNIFENSELLEV